MKPERSVEHVVTDLFAFLGTYDCRDERRILALDTKGPEAFRTFYASYLPLIITLWTQALQYDQPKHAERVSQAFLDEFTARLNRMGAHNLARDVLRGVAGLPGLLQRENGVVLVAAACVESMTGGNIPKKGKRANLLTQKILKILQFFINKLSAFDIVDHKPVRAPFVSMFFVDNSNGNGSHPQSTARTPLEEGQRAQSGAVPAARQPAKKRALAKPDSPPIPEPEGPPPVWATEPEPAVPHGSSENNEPAETAVAQPVRRELPPEPLTSDEPPLDEIEEVWAEKEPDDDAPAENTAQAAASDAAEAPAKEPDGPVKGAAVGASTDQMDDLFDDEADDEGMIVVDAEEVDDLAYGDDVWTEHGRENDVGEGDPYDELGMKDADADGDFSGFEFEEQDDDTYDRGIDVDEFHDVINQVVTEVLASQEESENSG